MASLADIAISNSDKALAQSSAAWLLLRAGGKAAGSARRRAAERRAISILDRVVAFDPSERALPADFGVRVSGKNIRISSQPNGNQGSGGRQLLVVNANSCCRP
ncbi:hypothetical protein P0R31_10275 [Bradyrhizobium yuanmingense]|uniref:hypothetical protein n=1 Tax=Bradyrhizobium yuanmingense TaxID=108015 RepID=UPI0023B967D7|nr:hypothetical protein [Bradyrhizobium yuanmingense]MDF0517616.1 hypothetical protein [Bradyrhizobium yuanmingense]